MSTTAAAPPAFLRRHRVALAALALLLLVLLAAAVRWWLGPVVSTGVVLRRDFVQSVVASGHVQAPHRIEVGTLVTGTVLDIPVDEGQVVQAGDVLLILDATEASAAGRQADAAVLQARARLRQLQEVQAPVAQQTLRQAQTGLASAQAAWARSRALFDQGFIGQAALDDARKTLEQADAQARSAGRQLETTLPAGSDHALAQANLVGAQAGAQAARARLDHARILAPASGTLIARDVEAGDVVQPGKILMTLSPAGPTQVVVQIDEKNLSLLALGQSAWVSADAYPAQRMEAVLSFINPGVNATTGSVEARLDVRRPPAVLRQDMTVSVDIEVARRPQALLAPLAAVHDADGPAPWVLRVEGRHAVRRPVQLGLRSGGLAEVTAGLAEGERLVTAPATTEAGSRIRTADPAH
ncbi:efflux RND transporter periplasmic adaptor subunit [uncultured Hydrogenophaga sp.]|uniref:efflux RND transporter periplasmic adaptor subunit n=1 Tax=uncultured Hydrogenophaga sp. TaxID=199683 RepID=UPI00265D6E3D|nr:efflux RND transporter periplasmic adaptor subunit [uncultured Hydrogenophaga sp.]